MDKFISEKFSTSVLYTAAMWAEWQSGRISDRQEHFVSRADAAAAGADHSKVCKEGLFIIPTEMWNAVISFQKLWDLQIWLGVE